MSDEAPTTETSSEGVSATPAAEGSADPKDGSSNGAPAAEPSSSSGSARDPLGTTPPAAKPTHDVEALLEAAAIADRASKARLAEADRKEHATAAELAKVARFLRAADHLTKGEKKAAIKEMFGDDYNAAALLEDLAMDVEIPEDVPVTEVVRREMDAREKARAKKEEAEANARSEQAAADKIAERTEIRQLYVEETWGLLKEKTAEYPHLHAYRDEVTSEKVLGVLDEFIKVNKRVPEPPELAPLLEAQFAAKQLRIDQALGRVPKVDPNAEKTIDQVLEEMDQARWKREAAERPALMRKDPSIPIGTPVPHGQTGKSPLDEILEKLERQDAEAAGQLSRGY